MAASHTTAALTIYIRVANQLINSRCDIYITKQIDPTGNEFWDLWPCRVYVHLSIGERHHGNVEHPDSTQFKVTARSVWNIQDTVHSLSLYQQTTMSKHEEVGEWAATNASFVLEHLEMWIQSCPLFFVSGYFILVSWFAVQTKATFFVFLHIYRRLLFNLLCLSAHEAANSWLLQTTNTEWTQTLGTGTELRLIPPSHKVCFYDHFFSARLKKKWLKLVNVNTPQALHLEQWIVTDGSVWIVRLSVFARSIKELPADCSGMLINAAPKDAWTTHLQQRAHY